MGEWVAIGLSCVCVWGETRGALSEEVQFELKSGCEKEAAMYNSDGSVIPTWEKASAKALRQK